MSMDRREILTRDAAVLAVSTPLLGIVGGFLVLVIPHPTVLGEGYAFFAILFYSGTGLVLGVTSGVLSILIRIGTGLTSLPLVLQRFISVGTGWSATALLFLIHFLDDPSYSTWSTSFAVAVSIAAAITLTGLFVFNPRRA